MVDHEKLVEELTALYVWPQSVADHHADVLTPRQIEMLYAVGAVAERAAATITELRAENARLRAFIEPRACDCTSMCWDTDYRSRADDACERFAARATLEGRSDAGEPTP